MFPKAGQNIADASIKGTNIDFQKPSDVIQAQTMLWFNEFPYCDMSVIKSYRGSNGIQYGHFTQIVRDASDRIGCAISQYIKPGGWYTNYYVCNYAFTNIHNKPIYDAGPIATKCKTGTNPNYPALCSKNEKFEYS